MAAGSSACAYLLIACLAPARPDTLHASRRRWAGTAASAALVPLINRRARAADAPAAVDLRGSVERTVADALAGGTPRDLSLYARPTYQRESDDIYYPIWLEGTWQVSSKGTGIIAPLGPELFGARGAYDRARATLDEPALEYRARFMRTAAPSGGEASCVCERPFTVASISRAAMGADAVLSVGGASVGGLPEGATSADVLEVRLRPSGAGGRTYRVQLQVVGRSSRATSATSFECAELTRQTVFTEAAAASTWQTGSPTTPGAAPSVKEIETTSTYDLQPSGRVLSRQRTATFLVADAVFTMPSNDLGPDLATLGRARAAGRYAVDVRTYDLQYNKAS